MAKKGDHVMTTQGPGTIISGKQVALHGHHDTTIPIKSGVILSVIKTKEQLFIEQLERDKSIWIGIAGDFNDENTPVSLPKFSKNEL